MRAKLERLNRLVGSDPGFYVLALHAFVEHYIRDVLRASDAERFPDVIWDYRTMLVERADGFIDGLNCLTSLARQHRFTNAVRHSFEELDPEEAAAATHLFVAFCGLVELGSLPEVRSLQRTLDIWNDRTSLSEQSRVLRSVQHELAELQRQNDDLLSHLSDYDEKERSLAELENRIERFTLELDAVRGRAKEKDAKVDELRRERARLRDERRDLQRRMAGYEDLERYIRTMGRLSVYTRSRLDYERSLMRLTPEQEEAASHVTDEADILIRGTAGTGKSLVLIESLRRRLEVGELDFGGAGETRALLLTFTRTLAKFEDYVAQLLGLDAVRSLVGTVDAFILDRLKRIDPSYRFDFELVDRAAAELNATGFFTDTELAAEIESYLFANFVSRQEYLDEMMPRAGMRRRLAKGQRTVVWGIRDAIAARMDETGAYSRNYARMRLLAFLEQADAQAVAGLRDVRTIFLDETQDLTSGDLLTLKSLVTGHLVMAADTQQSIYGISSPFVRAGIQIAGRTRLLRTNFRNTRQIADAAARFYAPEAPQTFAFREGPEPELHVAAEPDAVLPQLAAKLRLFLEHLGYEPENICVLAPHKDEIDRLSDALASERIETTVMIAHEFSFAGRGAVRLSTLHSSKGLDFPVVVLYLPYIRRRERYDEETTERLVRNLVYVGLTRAMENLTVFVTPGDDPVLHDLVAAMRGAVQA